MFTCVGDFQYNKVKQLPGKGRAIFTLDKAWFQTSEALCRKLNSTVVTSSNSKTGSTETESSK